MRVWVVERGAYSDRHVVGVYATAEAAMADNPIPEGYRYPTVPDGANYSRPGGWKEDERGCWDNGLDWDEGVSVEPYEVQGCEVFPAVAAVDPQVPK